MKKFALFVKETEAIADAWFTIIGKATRGFGGQDDSIIGNDKIMLKTLLKNSA